MDELENVTSDAEIEEGQTSEENIEPVEEIEEPTPQEEVPVEEAPPAVHQKQTANERIQQLAAEKNARKAQLEYHKQMEAQRAQAAPPQEDPNVLREKLEQMGDVERILWLQQQTSQQQALRDSRFQLQMQVYNDRMSFDRLLASNPKYQRYSDEVEAAFNRGLQTGRPQSREELLDIVLGKEVRNNAAAAMAKATKAEQTRIQQQTTRPVGTRSNVSNPGGKTALSAEETLRRRLEAGEYNR